MQLEEAKKVLNIESDEVFVMWWMEEKEYLLTLQAEPPADLLKMQYLQTLKKLCAAEYYMFSIIALFSADAPE